MRCRLLMLSACLLLPKCLTAAELQIACIDMEKVFQGYYKTIKAEAALKEQKDVYLGYAQDLIKHRDQLRDDFNTLRDDALNIAYTDDIREKKRQEAQGKLRLLEEKKREIEQYEREKRQELQREYEKERERILGEISQVVYSYAEEHRFDFIIDVSGRTLNNIASVVYFRPEFEITETILAMLNEGHEQEVKDAAANAAPPAAE